MRESGQTPDVALLIRAPLAVSACRSQRIPCARTIDFQLICRYNIFVKIVWDEPKRLANIAKHDGLDFADLDEAFFETSMVLPGKDNRLIAIGRLASGVVVVVFVALGTEGISVVSMRPASRKERKLLDG